jgi:hypothetical protein
MLCKILRTTSDNVVCWGSRGVVVERAGDEYECFPGRNNLAAVNQRQPVR